MSSFEFKLSLSGTTGGSFSLTFGTDPLSPTDNVKGGNVTGTSSPVVEKTSVDAVDVTPSTDSERASKESLADAMSAIDWDRLKSFLEGTEKPTSTGSRTHSSFGGSPVVEGTSSHGWSLPKPVPASNWFQTEVDYILGECFPEFD